MAILTSSGVATFNATSKMNVQITWEESFNTDSINSSYPYGKSTIKIKKIEALSKSYYGYGFFPSFQLKFNGTEVYEFSSKSAKQFVNLNSLNTWGTILNVESGTIFTKEFTYIRTAISETKNFTITKSTKDGWTYPGFYVLGGSYSAYSTIGEGASSWSASATLCTTYTNPSAPASVYMTTINGESIKTGNYYYYKNGGKTRLYWPAGTPGTNNPIITYKIYRSFKGGTYQDTTITSLNTTTIAGVTYYYYDVEGDIAADRGDYQTYKIQAIGRYSNSSLSSAFSPRLYKNRLPSKPVVSTGENYIPYDETEITLSYTSGSDPDGHSVRTYYSEGINSEKHEYNGGSIEVLSNSTTYYLWSYDGLEFSANSSSVTFIKNDKGPSVTNFNISHTEFTPYQRNNSINYATNITLNNITAEYGTHSSIRKYNYYARISSDSSFNSSNNIVLDRIGNSNYSFNVSNKITAGYYFKLGVSITTNLGETSNIKWVDNIYCSGTPITSNDFNPTFTITSTINNNRGNISNSSDIAGRFNNFIKIEWINPNITDTNRFGISKIECGYLTTSSASSFNVVEMQNSNGIVITPSITRGGISQIYMYIGDSVSRGTSITPAIRVTPVNGEPFIKTSNVKKTRTAALAFSGSYLITPAAWNFFEHTYNNTDEYKNFYFSGNKILGDTDFANPEYLNISIENNLLKSDPYTGKYSSDNSSASGKITFYSEDIYKNFYNDLKGLNIDSSKNSTYTISITDRYGNTASTVVTQTIDFRVAPEWTVSSFTTKIKYLNSDSSIEINSGTSINNRILNPGDEIQLSWDPATDDGNGNSDNIEYIVNCYTKDSSVELEYNNGILFFKDIAKANKNSDKIEYSYEIPSGSSTVKSIYFTIQAKDSSGLTAATTLSTSQYQALAIGRAVPPDFEVTSYNINNKGKLSGTLSISDFGDSRKINSSWTNYNRIGGLIFEERSASITHIINKEEIITSQYIFPEEGTEISGYETSGKQILTFYLYPKGIPSNTNSKIYLFSFDGPTFSYRNHQIGINIAADSLLVEDENGNQISKSVFSVAAVGEKDRIYFVSNSPTLDDIYLNLTEGKIYNLIIDCGEW